MYLSTLQLEHFRNHTAKKFEFSPQVNLISGENGIGKTNILDAIHCIALTKSYFQAHDKDNQQTEADYVAVEAQIVASEVSKVRYAYAKNVGKKFWVNETLITKLSTYIGTLPVIFFSPADSYAIVGVAEDKRRLFDTLICQLEPTYLEALQHYNKAIKQRNALLKYHKESKSVPHDLLEPWDIQLAYYGEQIVNHRTQFFEDFTPFFTETYKQLVSDKEEATLSYQTGHKSNMLQYLYEQHGRDSVVGRTLSGVHKDEITFKIKDLVIKNFASQGQQKTYALALKLSQYLYIADRKQRFPLLLLDDICDKLDAHRLQQLAHLINDTQFGQVFITDTEVDRIRRFATQKNYQHFHLL